MSTWCRNVHVRPHCFILTKACSCGLELAYFARKISKNRLVRKNAVALAYFGSCRTLFLAKTMFYFIHIHINVNHFLSNPFINTVICSVIDEEEKKKKKYDFYLLHFSSKKVPAETDQIADVSAAEPNSEISLPEILRRQYPHRAQCRFAGCGKWLRENGLNVGVVRVLDEIEILMIQFIFIHFIYVLLS